MDALQQQFIEFALQSGVLKFGEFRTKAGRLSPYFFNAGLFNRGATLGQLARFYARTLLAARDAGRVARCLQADGTYALRLPGDDERPFNSQAWLLAHRANWPKAAVQP